MNKKVLERKTFPSDSLDTCWEMNCLDNDIKRGSKSTMDNFFHKSH